MTKFILMVQLIASLVPTFIELIKFIENLYKESGQGSAKLAFLREIFQAVFEANKDGSITFDEAWPIFQKIAGASVSFMNTTGIFKKSA